MICARQKWQAPANTHLPEASFYATIRQTATKHQALVMVEKVQSRAGRGSAPVAVTAGGSRTGKVVPSE